eukprot:2271902-Rhodomonas_salina.1
MMLCQLPAPVCLDPGQRIHDAQDQVPPRALCVRHMHFKHGHFRLRLGVRPVPKQDHQQRQETAVSTMMMAMTATTTMITQRLPHDVRRHNQEEKTYHDLLHRSETIFRDPSLTSILTLGAPPSRPLPFNPFDPDRLPGVSLCLRLRLWNGELRAARSPVQGLPCLATGLALFWSVLLRLLSRTIDGSWCRVGDAGVEGLDPGPGEPMPLPFKLALARLTGLRACAWMSAFWSCSASASSCCKFVLRRNAGVLLARPIPATENVSLGLLAGIITGHQHRQMGGGPASCGYKFCAMMTACWSFTRSAAPRYLSEEPNDASRSSSSHEGPGLQLTGPTTKSNRFFAHMSLLGRRRTG